MKSDDFGRRPVGPNPTLYFFFSIRNKNMSYYEEKSKQKRRFNYEESNHFGGNWT